MRHSTWERIASKYKRDGLDELADIYGHSIFDPRCDRVWDLGQAICAEAYGPQWNNDPRFKAIDSLPDSEPAPQEMLEALKRLLDKDVTWATPKEAC